MLQYATKKGQPELEKRGNVCCEYVSGAWTWRINSRACVFSSLLLFL
jgi:hypothetical protein